MRQRHSNVRLWSKSCAAATAAACLLIGAPLGLAPDSAQAVADIPEPIASFDFDAPAAEGAYVSGGATATINGNEALEPGAEGQGNAARLSSDFWLDVKNEAGVSPLAGLDAVTISYDSLPDSTGNTGWAVYAARTADAPSYGSETYLGTLDTATRLTVERYANSGSRDTKGNLGAPRTAGSWQHVDLVLEGSTARLYVDAQLVDKKEQGPTLSEILGDNGGVLQLGKANWGGGEYFSGLIDNVTITPAALSAAQLGAPSPETVTISGAGIEQGDSGPVLAAWEGETTQLNATVTPAGAESDVVWASSDSGIAEVSTTGQLLAIAPGTATITASAAGDEAVQAALTVTVAADTAESSVERDAQALSVPAEVRGNFSLQRVGAQGSTVEWEILDGAGQATITDGVSDDSYTVQVERPAAGDAATELRLGATVTKGDAAVTREFVAHVQPLPVHTGDDEAYIWAFFTGEGVGGEKISLAASKGNDALDWNTLNGGEPLFSSTLGEEGLRDPFILRSPDGDTFYMIATDLKIDGRPGGFMGAQTHGSRAIEVWESTDLVNWSDQRHVEVSTGFAGNTWAPEAYWDEELGLYVVYWASNLYETDDPAERGNTPNYNRMMYATTPDFVEFSEPEVWIDVDRRGQAGAGSIDVTVAKHGDAYYRVYKDEKTMTLRQEHSNDLLATVVGSYPTTSGSAEEWVEDGTKIGDGQPNGYGGTFSAGEGPSLFPANPGDVNGYEYYLFADQPNYHGGPNHYVPMATNDITDASQWQVIGDELPAAQLPVNSDGGKPRHGTIVPVTRAQYEGVLAAFAPHIAVVEAAPVDVTTQAGVAPVLPEAVQLTTGTGDTVEAAVVWDEVSSELFQSAGVFTVAGTAQDDSRHPVTASVTVSEVPGEADTDAAGGDSGGSTADGGGGTAAAGGSAADGNGGAADASGEEGAKGGDDAAASNESDDTKDLAQTGSVELWPLAASAALLVLFALALLLAARRRAAAASEERP